MHTVIVNSRTPERRRTSDAAEGPPRRRSQEERRLHTRQALIEATLLAMEAGESFDSISLRSVTRAAGVVPTAFYRHFASMEALGLALVEESFLTLRTMLREAREEGGPPEHMVRRSVEILIEYVGANRQHFAFVARARSTGNSVLGRAIRNEIRLFTSELATDLARFPVLREWSTEDLLMLAGLLVNTMIATVEAMLELPGPGSAAGAAGADAEARIAQIAEKQIRLTLLGVPSWRSARLTAFLPE